MRPKGPSVDEEHRNRRYGEGVTGTEPRRYRASDAERDAVLEVLNAAHTAGRLRLGDLRERQERVLAADFRDELPALTADLPEGDQLPLRASLRPAAALPRSGSATDLVLRAEDVRQTLTLLRGRYVQVPPGESASGFVILGRDVVDLTAALGPGIRLEVEYHALAGSVRLLVLPGVRVVDETRSGVVGGVSYRLGARGDGSHGTLVLRGNLTLSSIEVRLAPQYRKNYR